MKSQTYSPPRKATGGITLLEMLVALALMSLLAVLALSTLSMAGRALDRSLFVTNEIAIMLARDELRSWLERSVTGAAGSERVAEFRGAGDSIMAEAIRDDGTFWPGAPVEVTLAKGNSSDDGPVLLRVTGLRDSDKTALAQEIALSGPTGIVTISYFGQLEPDLPADWTGTWPAEAGLPLLVRISISDRSGVYPPLIIRPGKVYAQREMSLSSLLPPALPSLP